MPRRLVRPAPLVPTKASYNAYDREVRNLLLHPMERVLSLIREGASDDDVRAEMRKAQRLTEEQAKRLDAAVERAGNGTTDRLDKRYRSNMKGVANRRQLDAGDTRARRVTTNWKRDNRALLRDTRKDQAKRLSDLSKDKRLFEDRVKLRKAIVEQQGIVKRRVRTITRDQVETLTGENARVRQQSTGISSYVWITVGDDRVRPSHMELDGTIRRWGEGIQPGEEVNCRCWSVPNVRVPA